MGKMERVAAEEFSLVTSKQPAEIRLVGQRAIASGQGLIAPVVKESGVAPDRIQYTVHTGAGAVRQMLISVSWRAAGQDRWHVTLEVPSYLAHRQTLLSLPVSPLRVPALGSLHRFATAFRAGLHA